MYKKVIASNRSAKFEYFIEDTFEAGIVLKGSEVKSLRDSKVSINEAFIKAVSEEIFLFNCYIAEYAKSNRFNHDTKRTRKLLLHKKQIRKIIGRLKVSGYSMVPLSIYFNEKNKIKLEIAIVKGKKLYDKREDIKRKDWNRDKQRLARIK